MDYNEEIGERMWSRGGTQSISVRIWIRHRCNKIMSINHRIRTKEISIIKPQLQKHFICRINVKKTLIYQQHVNQIFVCVDVKFQVKTKNFLNLFRSQRLIWPSCDLYTSPLLSGERAQEKLSDKRIIIKQMWSDHDEGGGGGGVDAASLKRRRDYRAGSGSMSAVSSHWATSPAPALQISAGTPHLSTNPPRAPPRGFSSSSSSCSSCSSHPLQDLSPSLSPRTPPGACVRAPGAHCPAPAPLRAAFCARTLLHAAARVCTGPPPSSAGLDHRLQPHHCSVSSPVISVALSSDWSTDWSTDWSAGWFLISFGSWGI